MRRDNIIIVFSNSIQLRIVLFERLNNKKTQSTIVTSLPTSITIIFLFPAHFVCNSYAKIYFLFKAVEFVKFELENVTS